MRWHFYDQGTGIFTGMVFEGSAEHARLQCPEGCGLIAGDVDIAASRVVDGEVVPFLAPRPPDTSAITWELDSSGTRWVQIETVAARIRRERSVLNARRDQQMQSLIVEFKGLSYQADTASRTALGAAIAALSIDPDRRTRWRTRDNEDVDMSPDDLRALFLRMVDAANAVHARAVAEKEAIR